jgi:hypothetical protein
MAAHGSSVEAFRSLASFGADANPITTGTAMTPVQKIKHMILVRLAQFQKQPTPDVTAENVDELYDEAEENDDGDFQDAKEEVRVSGEETGLRCEYSRHYESDAVAAKAPDGSWVGCTASRWRWTGWTTLIASS